MARVRDVGLAELPADVQPVYRRFSEDYGPFLNQVKVFAHRPPAVKHLMGLLLELADEQLLPKRLLEVALVTVSKLNQCHYCVAHHGPRLEAEGLAPETVAQILEPDCPGLDPLERLVRDTAVQVTETPQALEEAAFARLREHFSEAQIVELILRIALCGFFNRFNDALAIGLEEEELTQALGR
ncbi:MAG: peroxidase-related enzyme [Pseudomonadota bacterium]